MSNFLCVYSYPAYFILLLKSEKCAIERNKGLRLWSLLTKETSSWFLWLDHWKSLMPDLFHLVFEFLSNGEGLNCSLWHVLPRLSKITVTCPKWAKRTIKGEFDMPKVSKININCELLKVRKMASLKIDESPIMEKLETSNLDTW